jgi:hypothetical protein
MEIFLKNYLEILGSSIGVIGLITSILQYFKTDKQEDIFFKNIQDSVLTHRNLSQEEDIELINGCLPDNSNEDNNRLDNLLNDKRQNDKSLFINNLIESKADTQLLLESCRISVKQANIHFYICVAFASLCAGFIFLSFAYFAEKSEFKAIMGIIIGGLSAVMSRFFYTFHKQAIIDKNNAIENLRQDKKFADKAILLDKISDIKIRDEAFAKLILGNLNENK